MATAKQKQAARQNLERARDAPRAHGKRVPYIDADNWRELFEGGKAKKR